MARPRKSGPRHPCGKLIQTPQTADRGTQQLSRRRAILAAGADPVLATDPAGVMLARRLITDGQHAQCGLFRWAFSERAPAVLRTMPSLWDRNLPGWSGGDDAGGDGRARVWRFISEVLTGAEIGALVDVAVMGNWPGWLMAIVNGRPLTADQAAARDLVVGALERLRKARTDGRRAA